MVPDPDNCQCFYICNALGEAVRECCNRKELFDAKILNCNHEYLVNCGNRPKPGETTTTTTKRTTTKTTTTTTTPTTTTTTTTKPTTTATSTTTPLSTTSWEPSVDCDYDGQKLPYPGNCHKYYVCREWMKSSDFTVDVFDCGDWVFDPNQGICFS